MKILIFLLIVFNISSAQIALPTFHAVHNPQSASSSCSTCATGSVIGGGYRHSAAILENGTVKVWGYNGQGQLGQGNTQHIGNGSNEMGDNLSAVDLGTGRTATAIAAGWYQTIVVLDNGTVKAWGYNINGALGQGNTQNIGDGSNEMGDNLSHIDLSSGSDATLE